MNLVFLNEFLRTKNRGLFQNIFRRNRRPRYREIFKIVTKLFKDKFNSRFFKIIFHGHNADFLRTECGCFEIF